MQCRSCLKTFAATLSVCPSCGSMPTRRDQAELSLYCPLPVRATAAAAVAAAGRNSFAAAARRETATTVIGNPVVAKTELKTPMKREFTSTLIEFPKRNEWRDEIREKVREVRERRSSSGTPVEAEKAKPKRAPKKETVKSQAENAAAAPLPAPATVINLKPNLEERPTNRLVARALERVERARQVFDETSAAQEEEPPTDSALQPEVEAFAEPEPIEQIEPIMRPFSVVPTAEIEPEQEVEIEREIEAPDFEDAPDLNAEASEPEEAVVNLKVETDLPLETVTPAFVELELPTIEAAPRKEPRKLSIHSEADLDDLLDSQLPRVSAATPVKKASPRSVAFSEQDVAPRFYEAGEIAEITEDYAPLPIRFVAGLLDALVCAGATAILFAIFAPSGFFTPEKFGLVAALIVISVFAVLKFFYLTASITLAEKTPAGWLFSLRVVHAEDGSAPTIFESAANTIVYLLSLATAGIGLVPILFSTEKRALHDLASGTVVIREN